MESTDPLLLDAELVSISVLIDKVEVDKEGEGLGRPEEEESSDSTSG